MRESAASPSWRAWAARTPPLAWLAAAALVCCGGPVIGALGFYHDDWALLKRLVFAPAGYGALLRALAAESKLLYRPLEIPMWASLYWAFGLKPLGWHVVLWAANTWGAWALFRLARRYGCPAAAALFGALVFLAFPNRDSAFFWTGALVNALNVGFLAEALIAQADYAAGVGGAGRLAASAAALAVALGLYDQALCLAPAWLFAPGFFPRRRPAPRAWRGFAVAAATTGAALFFKLLLAPRLSGMEEPHLEALTFSRVPEVFGEALLAHAGGLVWSTAAAAFLDSFKTLPGVALAGLALPWLALASREREAGSGDPTIFLLAASWFVLSFAIFIPSQYHLTGVGPVNRLNDAGAFSVGLAAAGAAARVKARLRPGLAAIAGPLLAAHAGLASYWAQSYGLQLRAARLVEERLADWPRENLLLVRTGVYLVGGRAPVFVAKWDIGEAVKVWTRDPERQADVAMPWQDVFHAQGAVIRGAFVPYARMTLLDARRGTLRPVTRESLRSFLQ